MATPEEVSVTLSSLDAVLKSINDHINQTLGNLLINLVPFAKDVLQWIHDRVADISHAIEPIIGHITTAVGNAVQSLLPTAIDFLIGVSNNIFNDVHGILGNLATAEEFVAGAVGELSKHAGPFGNMILGAVGGGLSGGFVDLLTLLEGQSRETIDHFLDEILKSHSMPSWLNTMVSGLRSRGAEWQALALPIIVGVLLQPIGEAMVAPLLIELKQQANYDFKTQVRTPADLIELRLRGVIDAPTYINEMRYNNYSDQKSEELFDARFERLLPDELNKLRLRGVMETESAYEETKQAGLMPGRLDLKLEAMRPLLTEDEIRQTFLRGIIDRPKHDALLSQYGYTQERINQKVNLYYLIPGPQDLIHMGIRNVFNDEIVKTFNLSSDAPPQFFAAAAQQGISQDWALKYWEAHWIVPGIDEAFRMYQRTTDNSSDINADTITLLDGSRVQNIIGKSTLQLFLKDKDVPPYYRDKLTDIAYHPLNRIDIRRMRLVGSLTKAQVQRAYLDLGYSLTNSTLLADFVDKLVAQQKKDKAQPFIDGLRRKILDLYVAEKLELSDAAFALADLGFTTDEADHYLSEALLIQTAEDAAQAETGIGRIFIAGYIDEKETRTRLATSRVPAKAIDRLISKWNLTRELQQDTEHFHKVRDLTKGEVTEAYTDRLMAYGDAEQLLTSLGYPDAEAKMVLSLADYKAQRATRTATEEALKGAYVNGVRDLISTSNGLDSLGLPTDRRDALLSEWTLLRETRTEKIPIATLRDILRAGKISTAQVFTHLKRHRYTDDDANLLIGFWTGTL